MNPYSFDAIIFDHDGTLIDTESPDFEACRMLYEELGAFLTLEHWAETIVGRMDGYDNLFRELIQGRTTNDERRTTNSQGRRRTTNGEPTGQATTSVSTHTQEGGTGTQEAGTGKRAQAMTDLRRRLDQLWGITFQNVELMPGARSLLTELQAAGYPLGVATASDREWVMRWLTRFNLRPYFQVVATGDDIAYNKPAPDVYLFAASQLGVRPERCLVFEDTVTGLQAAKAAGMAVIAVPSHVTKSLDFSQADGVIDGLQYVTLEWIEGLAKGRTLKA